jgi:hypothetical protein
MNQRPRTRLEWIAITALLLLAAWFRFYDLGDIPKGLEHDEVATWHMVAGVLEGERPLYFEEGYGHEPLYNYLTALPMAVFGNNWLGERFWAPWLGVLAVAATYALMRRLFGPLVGLSAAGYQATVLWAFFFNRLGLRLNLLPFLLCLTAYCFWRGLESPPSLPPVKTTGGKKAGPDPNPPPSNADWSQSDRGREKRRSPAQVGASSSSPPWAVRGGLRGGGLAWFALSGLWMGVCFYTYMSARAVPIIVAAFSAFLVLRDLWQPKDQRPTLRRWAARWWPLLICFLVAALVMAPLALYLLDRPQDTETPQREGQVDYPLVQLLDGNPRPVLQNAWAIAKMWNFDGERYWQLNVSHRPVFVEPISGILFWIGALIVLWRWKEPRYTLLLLWIALGMVPSLLTSEAPSWPRTMLASPAALALPGIAVLEMSKLRDARSDDKQEEPARRFRHPVLNLQVSHLFLIVSLLLTAVLTYRDFLVDWPRHPRVRYAFQSSLTEALRYLDSQQGASKRGGAPPAVAMAGLSPHDMDPWTERSTLRRPDLDLRWTDTRSALVLPAGEPAWLITLDITPVDPALAAWAGLDSARVVAEGEVVPRGGTEHQDDAPVYYDPAYTVYALDTGSLLARIEEAEQWAGAGGNAFAPAPLANAPEFGRLVRLAGYQWLTPANKGAQAQLLTFWRVLETGPSATLYGQPALRIFLHLLDGEQAVAAGVDVLGAAADTWQPGDMVVQLHSLALPAQPGTYAVEVGWYVPPNGPRLPVDGAPGNRILLAPVEVR